MNTQRWAITAAITVSLVAAGAASGALASRGSPSTADPVAAQAAQDKGRLAAEDQAAATAREQAAADPAKRQAVLDAKSRADVAQRKAASQLTANAQAGSASTSWPTGIFQDTEAPAPGSVFLGTNRWVGEAGDHIAAVYAGVSGSDASTGRLLIAVDGPTMTPTTVDLTGSGALRVASADGSVLSITDAGGRTHLFDARTSVWQS